MKALSRIAAAMAALGITPGDANMLSRMGINRRGVSKHAFNKTTRGAGRRSRCKLKIASGPGSISAKADILQLCRQGKWDQAADMDLEHQHRCGEILFGEIIRAQWRRYGVEDVLSQG